MTNYIDYLIFYEEFKIQDAQEPIIYLSFLATETYLFNEKRFIDQKLYVVITHRVTLTEVYELSKGINHGMFVFTAEMWPCVSSSLY